MLQQSTGADQGNITCFLHHSGRFCGCDLGISGLVAGPHAFELAIHNQLAFRHSSSIIPHALGLRGRDPGISGPAADHHAVEITLSGGAGVVHV